MAFRVNHNIRAVNAHRNLQLNHSDLAKSLERLSSGVRINSAADGPAAFAISEHLRSQIVGVNQAIDNSETAVSLLQTTEANMGEITSLLTGIRQLIIHALNEGANDSVTLQADQMEIFRALESIDRIAENAQFGKKRLLDGSNGVSGTTDSDYIKFVGASTQTKDSKEYGFDVRITQAATQAVNLGTTALTRDLIKAGEKLVIIQNGKMASYVSNPDDTVKTVVQNLRSEMNQNGLDLDIELDDSGMIRINSRKYGSGQAFQVSSSSAGVLSVNAGEISTSDDGVDVKGTINGESTVGRGRLLTGIEGAKCIDGLSVRFFGDGKSLLASVASDVVDRVDESGEVNKENLEIPEEGVSVGRVYVNQNSMKFQVGGNLSSTIGFSLSNLRTGTLCSDVDTRTGYRCLGDIDVREYQGAQDALVMVDKAIERISAERGRLGAIQKNSLERNLSNLRVANENLISSESVIRDTDMAKEMATFTRNQIKVHSSTAMLAQANQVSENVLQLLE